MKIFINDIPVYILSEKKVNMKRAYGSIVGESEKIVPDILVDDVLIMNAPFVEIDTLLKQMTDKKFKKILSVFIVLHDKEILINYLKSKFKVIDAAGGIVRKDGKLLMIYRKKIWDIPKGKLDSNESIETCALREVEEETGVKAKINWKIDEIWHTYTTKKRYVLKKTHWYAMDCVDDYKMTPQTDEEIKKVEWMNPEQVGKVLCNSYRSIRYVMQEYMKHS